MTQQAALQAPAHAGDHLDDLVVAARRLRGRRQRARGLAPLSFLQHPLRLSLLRFGKLRCYDDQAEVDHKEGADLEEGN